jgi:hypothetical protein
MNSKCATCQKMLYRTDACKGVGVEKCGRADGGSIKLAAPVVASTSAPPAAVSRPDVSASRRGGGANGEHGQKGAASETANKRGGSSAVEPLTSNQTVEGSTPSRRSKSRAKASKGKAVSRRAKVAGPDGDASRLSAGRTAQAEVTPPDPGAILADQAVIQAKRRGRPISPNPKSPRAKYQRELMRDKRAAEKAAALKAQREQT